MTDRVSDTGRSSSGKVTPKFEHISSARGSPAESLQVITDLVNSVVPMLAGQDTNEVEKVEAWSPSQGPEKRRVSFSDSPANSTISPCPSPKAHSSTTDANFLYAINVPKPEKSLSFENDSKDTSSRNIEGGEISDGDRHIQSTTGTPTKPSQKANSENSRVTDDLDFDDNSPVHSSSSANTAVDDIRTKPSSKQRLEPIAFSDNIDSRPASTNEDPFVVSEQLQKWIRPLLQPLAIRSQAFSSKNLVPKPTAVAVSMSIPVLASHPPENANITSGVFPGTAPVPAVVGDSKDDIDDEISTASTSTGLPERMFYKHGVLSISTLDSLHRVNTSQFLDAGEFDDSALPGAVQRPRTNSSIVPAMLTKSIESIVCTKNRKIPTELLSTVRPRRKKFTSELNILQKKVLSLRSAANSKDMSLGSVGKTVYYGIEDTSFALSLPVLDRNKAINISSSDSMMHSESMRNQIIENSDEGSKTQRQVAPIGSMARMKGVKHKKLASLNRL